MIPKRVAGLVLVVALGAFTALALGTARAKSATFDEVKHVPAGYMFLRAGDYRLDLDNPPLARMIAALPLLVTPVRVDTEDPAWRESRPWWFGHRFLYEWNDADALLVRSRGAITVVAIGLILAIFFWSRTLFGPAAAALASVLAAFSPDLVAHGSLATTDLVLATFFFLTVLACERLFVRATPGKVAATGIALGAALASKYSAAALLPILAALALVEILADRPIPFAWGARRPPVFTAATRAQRARLAAALLGGVLLVAGATLWGVYRFRDAPTPPGAVVRPLAWEPGDLH
ncbi:MAG TPA: glycosyltransferase family 39 protein, partial [Dongiaceae bacterium]|nr:glycosyltransferase family 39 protein [Dongiaceae bacterium]